MRHEESRVLVVAPVGQDAEAMAGMLRGEGVTAEACAGAGECLEALERGAGAVLLTEEALDLSGAAELLESFKRQPAWSELPLLILTSGGESRVERLLEVAAEMEGGITVLERPIGAGTLLQTVRVALRSRARQYEMRDLLAEQERQRRELQESEAQFRAMFSVASVGKAQADPTTGRMLRVNAAFCQMTGYTEAELLARTPRDITHPDDREADWWRFCRMARGEADGYENEKRYVRADGQVIWVHVSANLIRDDEGRPVRTTAIIYDITQRKNAEVTMRRDLEALTRMHELSFRRLEGDGLGALLQPIMDAAVDIIGADKGTLQLLEADSLRIVAHHGHERPFLEFFAAAENRASTCGEAARRGERVVVPDVELSPLFAGTRSLAVLREAGVRAVQSTPLMSRSGGLLGALTTQWARPYSPETDDLKRIDLLARQASDVIEHAHAEAKLRESEERFRSLADGTPVLVWVHDAEGGLRFVNRAWVEFFGKTLEQASGENWKPLVHVEDHAGYVEEFLRCHEERREFHAQARVQRRDGQWRWIESFGEPRFSGTGEYLGMAGSSVDISTRKEAEEALAASERLYRAIGESINYGIWVCDAQGRNIYASDSFLKLVGITQEQCSDFGWGDALHPEDTEATIAAWKQCVQSGGPWYREQRFRGADGQWHPVLACGVAVRNERGEITRWAGINLDISRLKQTEAELRKAKDELAKANANLEGLVAERTAELRDIVGELEHFSYSITHDMRAPLRAMMGFAEVAKELSSGCEPEQKMSLDRIQTAAKRMDLLITDALNYSKAVRSELPLAPIDVGRLLRGMVHTYPELQVAEGGIRIELELPRVMGNEAGLTQCFSNLLGNAVRFVKPGEAPEIRVWGEVLADGHQAGGHGWVRIWVEDKGVGISKSMLPRVFDMFARGSNGQAGTGIGLALVRKVVQRMGGRVGVESEAGHGSRFWVELKSGDVMGRMPGG